MGECPRILIVDDDKSIRKTLEAILRREGYCTDVAENGRQVIEKMQSGYYDLALIDIHLPEMNGTELLSRAFLFQGMVCRSVSSERKEEH